MTNNWLAWRCELEKIWTISNRFEEERLLKKKTNENDGSNLRSSRLRYKDGRFAFRRRNQMLPLLEVISTECWREWWKDHLDCNPNLRARSESTFRCQRTKGACYDTYVHSIVCHSMDIIEEMTVCLNKNFVWIDKELRKWLSNFHHFYSIDIEGMTSKYSYVTVSVKITLYWD